MLKFYCESCKKHQIVMIEKATSDSLNKNPWGDIVCSVCSLVIATYSHEKEGWLEFIESQDPRLLTTDAPEMTVGDSAPSQAVSKPNFLSTLAAFFKPTHRR